MRSFPGDPKLSRFRRQVVALQHINSHEEDRSTAREFIDACRAAGEKSGFMAMAKMAH